MHSHCHKICNFRIDATRALYLGIGRVGSGYENAFATVRSFLPQVWRFQGHITNSVFNVTQSYIRKVLHVSCLFNFHTLFLNLEAEAICMYFV